MSNIGLIKKRAKIPLCIAKPAKNEGFSIFINDSADHDCIPLCGT
ncbi:hypothetical protein H098_28390 [Pseudomonas fluorescens FH5]|jgi:hypothetical protein|nr:hypothetical protein H098_28390 [Pseudomonas fluorescens FH5]